MKNTTLPVLLLAAAMLGGCGDDDGSPMPGPDAGMNDGGADPTTDAGSDDGGSGSDVGSCASPRTLTLTTSGATTLTGDTTGAPSTLTMEDCGGGEPAPQDVIAVTIPGDSGDIYGVRFDFAQDGTPEAFDTVVQIRETCGSETDAVCIDDGADDDTYRSVGQFAAPGGSTRFVVVTGYNWDEADAEGPYEATFEVFGPLSAPVLTGGTVLNVEGVQQRFTLMGTDADMDAVAFSVQFLDASGSVIGIDDDGDAATPGVETFEFGLDGTEGMASFTGTAIIGSEGVTELAAATTARIALIDASNLRSATMDITITAGSFASRGEACDATNVCTEGLECTSGTCAVPAVVETACNAATELTLSTTPASTVVTIAPGDGHLFASCGETGFGNGTFGTEAFVEVTGAEGHDIVIETAGTTTGTTDTVLYAMTACGDPSTEVACNDDAGEDGGDSRLEILDSEAVTYTIAVEVFAGVEAATMIDVVGRLRPVLATGAACDPAGEMNRCGGGACPTTGEAVCP